MIEIRSQFRAVLREGPVLHVVGVGFEERCLEYAQTLSRWRLRTPQRIICISPDDRGVTHHLQMLRQQHRKAIEQLLPSATFGDLEEGEAEIEAWQTGKTICIDISVFPRIFILRLLEQASTRTLDEHRLFVVYSYPKEYAYTGWEAAASIQYYFSAPQPRTGQDVVLVILPGFDAHSSRLAQAIVKATTGKDPDTRWIMPFPGTRFSFYERALQEHLPFLGPGPPPLIPQLEITLAAKQLIEMARAFGDRLVLFYPLGSRVICVPVLLASQALRDLGHSVNIAVPSGRQYSRLRSSGSAVPLVEEVSFDSAAYFDANGEVEG